MITFTILETVIFHCVKNSQEMSSKNIKSEKISNKNKKAHRFQFSLRMWLRNYYTLNFEEYFCFKISINFDCFASFLISIFKSCTDSGLLTKSSISSNTISFKAA